MSDVRQSKEYAQFIMLLGWQVEKLGQWHVFIKKFPLIGSLIKIQRITPPIPFKEIEKLAQKHHAFQVVIEPATNHQSPITNHQPCYRPLKSPFIPTKTLVLDLKRTEQEIFALFTKNKRRDIRIAERNNLSVQEGTQKQFAELKKKSLLKRFVLPLGAGREIFPLLQAFGPQKAKILLAYPSRLSRKPRIPLAGTLLLFHDKIAYYWQAASTDEGKKLLAPTLLVWEAIKLAKKKDCEEFDFEGVYDERFPKNKSWIGFTKFKQGFGGKEVVYPAPLTKIRFLGLSSMLHKLI